MDRLKGLALGLLMCLIAYIVDRSLENATRHTTLDEGEAGTSAGIPPSRNKRSTHLKEGQMRKSLMWYVNCVLLILVFGMFSCAVGEAHAQDTTRLRRPVVLSPLLKNNLSFLLEVVQERGKSEGAYCVVGAITRDTVHLNGIVIPWIDSTSTGSVYYRLEYCPSTTVAALHTHPSLVGECRQSPTDDNALHHSPLTLHIVACRLADTISVVSYWKDEVPYHEAKGNHQEKPSGIWEITYRYRRPP